MQGRPWSLPGRSEPLDRKQTPDFTTLSESIEDLDLAQLRHFAHIPDYREASRVAHPVIVKTPTGGYCIEGWELIEKAKSEGKMRLTCHIYRIRDHSAIELALRKVSIRTLPQGGKEAYAETVRNMRLLSAILSVSHEDPALFSHGGPERGRSFTSNTEDNVRTLLSQRLGKSVATVNEALVHGEYLNEEALQELIELEADEGYFKEAQKRKRFLVKNLRHEGWRDEEIAARISREMIRMFEEYRERGRILTLPPTEREGEGQGRSRERARERQKGAREVKKSKRFAHWTGNKEHHGARRVTMESIKGEAANVAKKLVELAGDRGIGLDREIETVRSVFVRVAQIFEDLKFLKEQCGSD
jgi:hypothetical protein